MDLAEIRKIIELMDENDLVEFEHESDGKRIKLRRAEPNSVVAALPARVPAAVPGTPSLPAEPADEGVFEFKSPLVGTFYRAGKPDAEPYVNPGDEVNSDKVLCIIEAMKVMNEIKAEINGVVREVLAKNGQAVEFGEPLFLIERK